MDVEALKPDLLKQEFGLVVDKVNHFDTLRHRTKQLAVTLWLAIIGVALAGDFPHAYTLIFVAPFVPWPLWYLDATYHAYQEGFNLRRRAIEAFVNNRLSSLGLEENKASDFPIPDMWGGHTPWREAQHKKETRILYNAFKVKMLVFYLPLVVVPFAIACLAWMLGPAADSAP